MKNKKNVLFGFAIIIIYIVTVLSYSISLFAEYKEGPFRAEYRFRELIRETSQNLQVNKPGTEAFTNTFLRSVGDLSDIAGIQLVEDNNLLLSYPKNISENSGTITKFAITKSESLFTSNGKTLTVTAAIYSLKPNSIYKKGLISFFIILITTLCCVFYMLVNSKASSSSKVQKKEIDDKEESPEDFFNDDELYLEDSMRIENDLKDENDVEQESQNGTFYSDMNLESPESLEETVANEKKDFSENDMVESVEQNNLDFIEPPPVDVDFDLNIENTPAEEDFDMDIDENSSAGNELENCDLDDSENDYMDDSSSLPIGSNITQEEYQALTKDLLPEESFAPSVPAVIEKKPLSPDEYVLKPLPTLEPKIEEEKAVSTRKGTPEGLFSPITGFCWEEYMLPRLDSELMRSAASDQDVALFTLSIPKLDWAGESGKAVSELIQKAFKFRDMIFEYKDTGCFAIVQGMDSKKAQSTAENLHTDIISELAKRHEYRIVSIGIANRSLRLISGGRLATESEQALLHAMEDKDSPIVLFKVNHEKYRTFIAEEAVKQELANSKAENTGQEELSAY